MRSSRLSTTQPMPADVSLDPAYGLMSKIGIQATSHHVTSLTSYMPARSPSFSVRLFIIITFLFFIIITATTTTTTT